MEIRETKKETGSSLSEMCIRDRLYYAAPYDPAEEIEKSSVVLGAFEKTNTLKPVSYTHLTVFQRN